PRRPRPARRRAAAPRPGRGRLGRRRRFQWDGLDSSTPGDHAIGTEGGAGAAPRPGFFIETERARKFVADETGGDADVGVVPRDIIGMQQRAGATQEKLKAPP